MQDCWTSRPTFTQSLSVNQSITLGYKYRLPGLDNDNSGCVKVWPYTVRFDGGG